MDKRYQSSFLRRKFFQSLGSCQRCVRKAALAAISFWCLALLMELAATPGASYCTAVIFAAGVFTLLWAAHLLAFAVREAKRAPAINDNSLLMRRTTVRIALNAFISMAAITALPVFADNACGDGKFKCGVNCCDANTEQCCQAGIATVCESKNVDCP